MNKNPFLKAKAANITHETNLEASVRIALDRSRLKYRTQVQIGRYRVDFLVGEKVVVEADSERYHPTADVAKKSVWAAERYKHDKERDEYLRNRGYEVVRLRSADFRKNPDSVLAESLEMYKAGLGWIEDGDSYEG